ASARALLVVGLAALVVAGTCPPAVAQSDEEPPGLPLFPMRIRWSATLDATPTTGPVSDGTSIYLGLDSGVVVAVDADTGAERWTSDGPVTRVPPAADGDGVYVVRGRDVVALDAATGEERWRLGFDADVSAPLIARAGWVVVALASGEVTAVRGADGVRVWQSTFATPVVAQPAINGARLYLPGDDARVRAVHIETGALEWEQTVGGAVLTISPLGDRVFVGADDNFFYALDDRNGRRLWRWRTGGDPIGDAVADERRVYFTSLDTIVRALDRRNGAQIGRAHV